MLQIEGLTVRYGQQVAVSDVSLSIKAHRVTALVGPSGCGKTSFLSSLNRLTDLIPACRVTGTVRLDGRDVRDPSWPVIELRRRVGMIFQKPNPFPLSIRKNLTFPLREHGVRDRNILKQAVESALQSVGLWTEVKDRLDKPALALSGGQQQRLCMARALALKPDALLMDEPCSALDPLSSGVVESLITELRSKYTVVMVTHNLAQARRVADSVAVFWTQKGVGRLIEHGSTAQIFESPVHSLTAAYVDGARG